jgi:hypothetical protein
MPRALRWGGYMSPAAVRASRVAPLAVPMPTRPASTAAVASRALPSAASPQPAAPTPKPAASTGTRPKRSIKRPAGTAASALAVSTIAGPRPSSPVTSSTRTRVIEAGGRQLEHGRVGGKGRRQ